MRSRSSVVFHALAALRHRNRTGEGQWIDASMGETVIGQMHEWFMDYFMNGRDRRQWGNRDDVMAPHNTYRMRRRRQVDRDCGRQRKPNGKRSVACMGNPAWARDAKFADQFSRWKNRDELDAHLARLDARSGASRTRGALAAGRRRRRARCSTASNCTRIRICGNGATGGRWTITKSASEFCPGCR